MRKRERNEVGAIAIIVAILATALLVIAAMVVDFGLVRVDRQVDKSAADSAVLAGLQGLSGGDANPHPFAGVCTARRYLAANNERFADLISSGTWADGDGNIVGFDGCSDEAAALTCDDTAVTPSSWARFTWSGTHDGAPLSVVIQSGYQLSSGSGFSEDSLTSADADGDDGANGCGQLAVIVTQSRTPGLGSLATDRDLTTAVRSVGRVEQAPGGSAPAMLLLKRTGCPVLQVGSIGGGADSRVRVFGAVSSNNLSQPGSIHADSNGEGCSGGGNAVYYGKGTGRIVAFGAPTVGAETTPDPTKPGLITSTAVILQGLTAARDNVNNVYATGQIDPLLAAAAAKIDVVGRPLVSRKLVDDRYRDAVQTIISGAQSTVFGALTNLGNANAAGYETVACNPSGSIVTLPPFNPAKAGLYISCGNLKSAPVMTGWQTVVFSGTVTPAGAIAMPDATRVYVFGGSNAVDVGTGGQFQIGVPDVATGRCSIVPTNSKAVLVLKTGGLKQSGSSTSILRLCNTTAVLMGGSTTGCLPTYSLSVAPSAVPGPSLSPCSGASGTGQTISTGGIVDWTPPNRYDRMTLDNGDPDPARAPAWTDPSGPEDLALWSESGSNDSGPTPKASIGGGGETYMRGVFMAPNFQNLTVGGGSLLDLRNAQFVATSIALNGGTQLLMRVDPNSAVTLPKLTLVGLVR